MTGVELDSNNFHKRARILTSAFKVPTHKANNKNARKSDFNSADFLLVPVGSADEDENPYSKGTSLQIWLLGYEFPDTVMAVTENGFVFMTSAKKGSILESLVDAKGVPIQIIKRSKDAEENAKLYPEFFSLLSKSFDGKKMGVLAKENPSGKFITEFNSKKSSLGKEFENVDITSGIASVLVVKDEEEIKIVKHSAKLSSVLLNDIFVEEMQNVIDSGTAISHEKMSSILENKLLSEKERAKLKLPADLVLDLTDWSYTPIIQSGGKYDLKPSAISNGDKLHAGTILCSLGGRYKSYCTNISRTYLVDPEKVCYVIYF
jgi:nucleosome binding factor SPN SPT16 subunit